MGNIDQQEKLDRNFKEQAAKYFEEQLNLIKDQKEYAVTIKFYSKVTAWATIIMAIATAVMAYLSYLQNHSSDNKPMHETSKVGRIDSSKVQQGNDGWEDVPITKQESDSIQENIKLAK